MQSSLYEYPLPSPVDWVMEEDGLFRLSTDVWLQYL